MPLPAVNGNATGEQQPPVISAYQQMINSKYPFERLLPANSSSDPDVLMNHILTISFLADRATIRQQATLQAAEEYAMQKCMMQCKRDGRMKREKSSPGDGGQSTKTIDQQQLLAAVQAEIDAGKMSATEIRKFQQTKAFQAALDAIPWPDEKPEATKATTAAVTATAATTAAAATEPKPFLATSIFGAPAREMSETEKAELRYEKARQLGAANANIGAAASDNAGAANTRRSNDDDDNDDNDVDDKPGQLVEAPPSWMKEENGAPRLSAADLRPAIPADAQPTPVTAEQLAADPNNPEFVPQPVKERENRFSYAAKFDDNDHLPTEEAIKAALRAKKAAAAQKWQEVDENVAGYVADGSVVPVRNEGALARADLPPVYRDGPAHREKVMRADYDPTQDKPFLWNKNFKKIVVSMIGPDCPQKCPRRLFRVWGGVKNDNEADALMAEVLKKNPYGYRWRTYLYSIQRWIEFPPKGDPKKIKGTVMEGNNEFEEYLQAQADHQKYVNVELEQRALDARAQERTQGQTIMQQLKEKNMQVDAIHPSLIPR